MSVPHFPGKCRESHSAGIFRRIWELKASVLQLMKRLEDIDLYEMTAAVKQIAEYKLTVNDYFDLMMIWFRDVLYMKATNDVNGLIFKDEVYDIKNRQQSGRIRN